MNPDPALNANPLNIDNSNQKRKSSNIHQLTETKLKKSDEIIDLSDIEANEESLKPYTYTKQFLKLDLDKIRELIVILEDYWMSLVEKEDINLAKTAKQRLILLKKIEKEKMMIEAKIIYSNQIELVEDKMKEELDAYILNSETEYLNLMQRFKEQEAEMERINKEELEVYEQNFEQNYSQLKPKPSKECLNWMKIRKFSIKQNKFNKAQEATAEIERLNNLDNIKFNKEKEKKLHLEINKIKHRQETERKVYEMKKNSIITQFNENRQKESDKIKKKYMSKISELKNYQNFEISNFDKITKGVIKPCSRIQNIVSSATGIKEEDDEVNENEKNKENNKEENKENDEEADNKAKDEDKNEEKEIEEENKKGDKEDNMDNNKEEDVEDGDLEGKEEGEEYINKEE